MDDIDMLGWIYALALGYRIGGEYQPGTNPLGAHTPTV